MRFCSVMNIYLKSHRLNLKLLNKLVSKLFVRCINGNIYSSLIASEERRGFPGSSDGKESACRTGVLASIPVLGRSPGEGKGNLLQYSHLENPMDRGTWRATTHKEWDTTEAS